MNNFQQKNIIANIKNNKDLPYQNGSDVFLKTNQNINAITLNNTFQQLVDNDLFNERHLIVYNNSSYGAKISSDIDEYSALNGTKIFDKNISNLNSSLEIYKKVEQPLSSTLVKFNDSIVNFFVEDDLVDGILVGTTNGLYCINSVNSIKQNIITSGNFIGYIKYGNEFIVATTSTLYRIGKDNYNAFKIKATSKNINNIACIVFLDKAIYIGTNDGLKYCSIDNLNNIYDIQGIDSSVKALTIINVNSNNKILAATDTNQYINENVVTFTQLKKVDIEDKSLIRDQFQFKNKTYYVTNDGNICYVKKDNNNVVEIKKLNGISGVTSVTQSNNETYIVAGRKLYSLIYINENNNSLSVNIISDNISNLTHFFKFNDYNIYVIGNEVQYNKDNDIDRITLLSVDIDNNILKFINIANKYLYIVTKNKIYIINEISKSENVFVDYNNSLSYYTNISNFVRIEDQLYGISGNILVKINRTPTVDSVTFSDNIRFIKQLNNLDSIDNKCIFIGFDNNDNTVSVFNNNNFNKLSNLTSTSKYSVNGIKDICFTDDYLIFLSSDNTIKYFDIYDSLSDLNSDNITSLNLLSYPISASKIDGLQNQVIAYNNDLSILEKTSIVTLYEHNYSNEIYNKISTDIINGSFGNIIYFNNFSQQLYISATGNCFIFDAYDTNTNLTGLPSLSALHCAYVENGNNSIIYSRKTEYDDLTYNKYYLLFNKIDSNTITCYETIDNDLQIDNLYDLYDLEPDDYNITNLEITSDSINNIAGFLTHTFISDNIQYDEIAAVATSNNTNTKIVYTDTELQTQKILSGSKYFATPYPIDLSTAKEDVQLEIGIIDGGITINSFSYLNNNIDIENDNTKKPNNLISSFTNTQIKTSSIIGIDYVPINDKYPSSNISYVISDDNNGNSISIDTYSFENNIFLYGPSGIYKINEKITLSDSIDTELSIYKTITIESPIDILSGNIQKLRVVNNNNKYGLLFLSANNSNNILYYSSPSNISSEDLTNILSTDILSVKYNTKIISGITDFDIIGTNLYLISDDNLISGTFNATNHTLDNTSSISGYSNTKLYRTRNNVSAILSSYEVLEDNHFHNIENRCFFVKQNNTVYLYRDNENTISSSAIIIPNNITISSIKGIRYVEESVSYFNNISYDFVLSVSANENGLYIEDTTFDITKLISSTPLNIDSIGYTKFVGQFQEIEYSTNNNTSNNKVNVYVFAGDEGITCKALRDNESFSSISTASEIQLSVTNSSTNNISGVNKQLFIYNGVCYLLTEDSSTKNYNVYKIVANVYKNNENNNISVSLNATLYEQLPITQDYEVEKILILRNTSKIGYYINNNIYTREQIFQLQQKNTINNIKNYYINGSYVFLIPTNNNISLYIENSDYATLSVTGLSNSNNNLNNNLCSFNFINDNVYISYEENLSTFSLNNISVEDNNAIITDLREVNSFLSDEVIYNTLFTDTYQISSVNNKRFVNVYLSNYYILSNISNNGVTLINGCLSNITILNDNQFRANTINGVVDFTLQQNNISENKFSINDEEIAYMYNKDIYKSNTDSKIYYYNGYKYNELKYDKISDVYFISENVLFDNTSVSNVYTYSDIHSYTIFKQLSTHVNNKINDISVGKYLDINDRKYILKEGNNALYKILEISDYNLYTQNVLSSDSEIFSNVIVDDTEIDRFTSDKKIRYILLSGNNIFYTYDFNRYLQNNSNINFLISVKNDIKDVAVFNIHEYLIATVSGLSCTKYRYDICSNVYTDLTSNIQDVVSSKVATDINNHISTYHRNQGIKDLIPYINENAINIDFSNINIGTRTKILGNINFYNNDIVVSVEFDNQTPCISAYQYIDNKYIQLSDISYIIKNYASGQRELYLNIPTTNTYYIPHIEGNIGCNFYNDDLYRKNVKKNVVGNPCSSNNEIYLFVSKDYFNNQPIVEVNGSSLPLGIYKDLENTCMDAEKYYHSYCLQTLVSEISDTANLSTIVSSTTSSQNIATLTCSLNEFSSISVLSNVKFITSAETFIVDNILSSDNLYANTYVTYTSSYTSTNTLTSLSTDKFFNTNSWRIKLRCFGTDEQSIILRKRI